MKWTPLHGISKNKFKTTKHKFSLSNFVQIHHIIPRQFRNHPVVSDFNIEDGSNYMFMPNKSGKLFIQTLRPNHQGGHQAYNNYVKFRLEDIYKNTKPHQHLASVQNLTIYLRTQICNGCKNIPWK